MISIMLTECFYIKHPMQIKHPGSLLDWGVFDEEKHAPLILGNATINIWFGINTNQTIQLSFYIYLSSVCYSGT